MSAIPHWETILQEVIFPDLLRGRKNFDLPHTQAVVYWMKQICKGEKELHYHVLVAAAYAHDWGYIDLFSGDESDTLAIIQSQKALHMVRGAEKIEKLLGERMTEWFSPDDIARVAHLVRVHDRLDICRESDEIALVEADTLGALDADRVQPTFSSADNEKYINQQVMQLRRPLFIHRVAIDAFDLLLTKRMNYYRGKY